jgi:hypothetical protein
VRVRPEGWSRIGLAVLLCLTLGLAPFVPEPHIVGKVRWVAGGAVGMGAVDWFDLVLHGSPFVLLVGVVAMEIIWAVREQGNETPL